MSALNLICLSAKSNAFPYLCSRLERFRSILMTVTHMRDVISTYDDRHCIYYRKMDFVSCSLTGSVQLNLQSLWIPPSLLAHETRWMRFPRNIAASLGPNGQGDILSQITIMSRSSAWTNGRKLDLSNRNCTSAIFHRGYGCCICSSQEEEHRTI